MKIISKLFLVCSVMVLPLLAISQTAKTSKKDKNAASVKKAFNVYAFIVYAGYMQGGTEVKASNKQLREYLYTLGINEMDLLYEQKMLDYPAGDKENGVPNNTRIDSLALEAKGFKDIPVSLDLEGWKRFDTIKTPQRMLDVISRFKKINKTSKVGLYATVPQNTYAYAPNISRYDKVNKAYAKVAAAVDYYSPSLYNYDIDTVAWNKSAVYNMLACKKYGFTDKPIMPYITPEVNLKGEKRMLTYDEMMNHLQTLYSLGASGVLIWTSSGTRDAQGNRLYIDANSGWLKAVRDFMANR
jgi:hypothetical protein